MDQSVGSADSLLPRMNRSVGSAERLLPRIALLANILEKVNADLTLAQVLRLDWVRKRTRQLGWAPTPTNVIALKDEMQSHVLTERLQSYLDTAFVHWHGSCGLSADLVDIDEGDFEAEPGMDVTYTSSATGEQYGAKVLTKHPGLSPEDSYALSPQGLEWAVPTHSPRAPRRAAAAAAAAESSHLRVPSHLRNAWQRVLLHDPAGRRARYRAQHHRGLPLTQPEPHAIALLLPPPIGGEHVRRHHRTSSASSANTAVDLADTDRDLEPPRAWQLARRRAAAAAQGEGQHERRR